ncbi:MAG: glgE [Dehalococcoidales bacterium]|nr:glgE [Dehalococcoidales bacterium]
MSLRPYPHLYEINARLLVRRLSARYRREVTLASIPAKEWQLLRDKGFDLVWLMGVWQRSPAARREALLSQDLRREFDRVLPGWSDEDVAGSPYAINDYRLDPALGKQEELAAVKSQLNRLGMGLIVDFVPNHLALDHPWTRSHPEWFVAGTGTDVRTHPDWFFSPGRGIHLAHGRDPNFPPWSDTAQTNIYSPALREAITSQLLHIAEIADGVRCDMAMLVLNEVFERTWGETLRRYLRPETEFWTEAIATVKQRHPDFLFLAEVYWGYESKLQQIGFDFTKDKVLYDHLRFSTATDVRVHLTADCSYQRHSGRFIENHDELRAVTAFGRERSLAAAVILATIPGLRLFHDGQFEGRRLRLPVQLVRPPEEATDAGIVKFYGRLLAIANESVFHDGRWSPIDTSTAWDGNESHHNLLTWLWRHGQQLKLIAVNYSPNPAQGWLKLPLLEEAMEQVVFRDELSGTTYIRDTGELSRRGLYVDLPPYQSHLLTWQVQSSALS